MNKYTLDFVVFVTQRLPQVLRQTRMIVWLLSLLAPIKWLYNQFKMASQAFLQQAQITPQRRILRGALNNQFDPLLRRIEINDGGTSPNLYIFNELEKKPVYLPQFIQGTAGASFTVVIPASLSGQIALIRQFVNRYKLPVLQFTIVQI
jgi:hypothetical protein